MKRTALLISIFLFQSWILFSQEARISIFLHAEQVMDWSILDENYQTLVSAEIYPGEDSVYFFLPFDKQYYLYLDLGVSGNTDSLLLELFIDGNHILAVLDTKEGDVRLPFYTGDTKSQLKIVGGTDAAIENFPWQVYFQTGDYMCGGSIIGDTWILTAAHCVFDDDDLAIPVSQMAVKVGTTYPKSPASGQIHYVKNVIIHENYSPDIIRNDIALLELRESIDISTAHYIELISTEEIEAGAADPGVLSWVTGWGLTSVDPDEFPSVLQKVQLPIVSNSTVFPVWGTINESVLMAGYSNGNKDACNGDSGGPLVVPVGRNFRLAGIVSWGNEECSTYGGYTRISYFEDWIRSNTGIERRYIPEIPYGDSLICETELSTAYTAVPVIEITDYEWGISPAEAGSLQYNNGEAEISWAKSFVGTAELSIRALAEGEFTEWVNKTVLRLPSTSVINQMTDTSLCAGLTINLSVKAIGNNLDYLWKRNGEFYKSGTQNSIYFNSLSVDNSADYSCDISGYCGSASIENIQLEVFPTTVLMDQSTDQHIENGESLFMEVFAEGHNLDYTWKKNGEELFSENENQLIINAANAGDIGLYSAEVMGSCGTVESDSIYVFVSEDLLDYPGESNFLLWPSIVASELNIALETDDIYSISVYDLNGKLILKIPDCQYKTTIAKYRFSSGMHFVKIETQSFQKTQKFIVP